MNARVNLAFMKSHWSHLLALGFGSGLSPIAPGTAGTLVGFLLYGALCFLPVAVQLFLLALLWILGVWICDHAAHQLRQADPAAIVWDEIVAFALVLQLAPHNVLGFMVAFILFRLFDIWKPFPVSWADRHVKGGLGIMLDDLLAAGYAMLVLWHLQGVLHG